MTKTAELSNRIMKATRKIPRPTGIAANIRVVLGQDATSDAAAWIHFDIDDSKAEPSKLLKFQRVVEQAAAKVDPAILIYVRFSPVTAAGKTAVAQGTAVARKAASGRSSHRASSRKAVATAL